MPRGPSGIYSLPPGYEAITGQTIQASQHNPPLEDIASALTGSLPRNGSGPMLAPLPMGGNRVTNLGAGIDNGDAVSKSQMDTAIAAAIVATGFVPPPPGLVGTYAGAVVPTGWLECNGSAISRTTYAALFTAIGTRYGAGDGTTTFNLPELRGEFLRSWDNGRGLDPGRALGSTQVQDIQSHSHGVNDPGHQHSVTDSGTGVTTTGGGVFPAAYPTDLGRLTSISGSNISIQAVGGPETRPRNVALWAIIKT